MQDYQGNDLQKIMSSLCMGCMNPKTSEQECSICGYIPNSPTLASYLPAGTILHDRYILGKLIHCNGESAEYMGYDTENDMKVIIKEYMPVGLCTRIDGMDVTVVQESMPLYKAFMTDFVDLNRSLSKMSTLNHINVPLEFFGANRTGYIVFKHIEGQSLDEYLKDNAGYLTWDEAKTIFSSIFTTLSLVHSAGIIHRGLSPENILIGDNETKIVGFAIADERTDHTDLYSELYHGYAAPEQYSSSVRHGTWTDVYGICALLYRVLTGANPYDARERLISDTMPTPKEVNSNIPENISSTIMAGMKLAGEERIQTITELVTRFFDTPAADVRGVSQTQTIAIPKTHSTKSTASHKSTKKKKNRTAVVIIGIILAIILFFVMIFVIMSLDDSSTQITTPVVSTTTTALETELDEESEDIETTETDVVVTDATESTAPTLAVIESETEQTEVENASANEETVATTTTAKVGSTLYIMNDLVGKLYDTVKNSSISTNLTLVVEYIYTDEYEKGIIISQSIAKGTNYEQDAECVIEVSMGPSKVIVPDFTGLSKKDYFALLNSYGIKYEEQSYETSQILDGYVAWISMDPGEYIDLEAGETLTVFVAVNPDSTQSAETTVTESTFATIFYSETTTEETTTTKRADDIIITDDY